MMILIVLLGLLFAVGLFFILAEVFKLPRLATGKAMISAVSQNKGKAKNLDVLIGSLSVKLAKHLPMDEYKKSRMKNTLKAAGMNQSPEEFMAFALVKALLVAFGVIPCLRVLPLLAPVLMFLPL